MDFVLSILSHSALKVSVYTVVLHKVAAWGRFYVSCMYLGSSTGLRTIRLVSMCMQMISNCICPSSQCRLLRNMMRSEHLSKLVQPKFELGWSPTDSMRKINDTKTEFHFVGSYQQLSKVQFESVTVGILKSSLFSASALSGHGFQRISPWAFMWAKSAIRPSPVYIPSDRPDSNYQSWFTFL